MKFVTLKSIFQNRKAVFWRTAVPIFLLVVGFAIGFIVRDAKFRDHGKRIFYEHREGTFRFINPLLECDTDQDMLKNQELRPFKTKVEAFLNTQMSIKGLSNAAVYFRELNDGLWFEIGDTERFTPASMRKVPMLIAVLRQSERQKDLLSRRIAYRLQKDYNAYQGIRPSQTLVPGMEYTVAELLSRMIVYSDNNAFMLLSGIVDPDELHHVYTLLSVRNPGNPNKDDFLSVYTYASFFRILYNATYLSKDLSDVALEFLSRTEFKTGIRAGAPPTVAVAHKFGEHSDDQSSLVQLHDCGIVYYPRHPYLLCIMTRGQSFEHLDDVIASISRIIYDEVEKQRIHEH